MHKSVIDRLSKLIEEGEKITEYTQVSPWTTKVVAFISTAVGEEEADEIDRSVVGYDLIEELARRLGYLEGLVARAEAEAAPAVRAIANPAEVSALLQGKTPVVESKKVFLVHGHDNEAKEQAARFMEKLRLQPIVLHEQPNAGQTIIEKFETYSGDIAFAVVLLTPDDFGGLANKPDLRKPRARQNVILELGYFMGRLGRSRVCALYKGGVELPSDYQGILYVEIDPAGAWKTKLAQEFVRAKLPIDLNGLVRG